MSAVLKRWSNVGSVLVFIAVFLGGWQSAARAGHSEEVQFAAQGEPGEDQSGESGAAPGGDGGQGGGQPGEPGPDGADGRSGGIADRLREAARRTAEARIRAGYRSTVSEEATPEPTAVETEPPVEEEEGEEEALSGDREASDRSGMWAAIATTAVVFGAAMAFLWLRRPRAAG